MIIMARKRYSSTSRRRSSSTSRRRSSSMSPKRYSSRHYYNRTSGWNARRWSSDPIESRAAKLRDMRADRRLAADSRRKREEEARRRRYHRRGLRIVGPRYYQGYNYPIMRTPLPYFFVLLIVPFLIFGAIFFTLIGSSSLMFIFVPAIILTVFSLIVSIFFITIIYRKRTSIIKKAIFEEPPESLEIVDDKELEGVICPYCGNSNKEDVKRCNFCDAKLID
jgi:hypothetical protein